MTKTTLQFQDDDASPLALAAERLALLIALAIVVARCTMLETIRDPMDLAPGSDAPPSGPGATTSLVLSLLSLLPAVLVLARGAFDRGFRFTRSFALVGLVIVGIWAMVSAFWASDPFMAAIAGFNWLSGMMLAWAMAQVVRTPARAKIVGGVLFGLLLIFLVHTGFYLRDDLPALREQVEKNGAKLLAERGWTADSFEGRQFLQKITAGELVGFSASPNSFAANLVITMTLTVGLALNRLRGKRGRAWAIALLVPVVLGCLVVYGTNSRAALATIVLAACAFAIFVAMGPLLARHAKGISIVVAAGGLGIVALLLVRGLTTGTMFHDSLTFRWRYWVGAWQVFVEQPIAGVGWDNFGSSYLAKRLAIASEEIRDPHNFIVRFFTELGIVGGALAVASFSLLLWEITRPSRVERTTLADDSTSSDRTLWSILATPVVIAATCMGLNILATIDWSQSGDYVDFELRKRLMYGVLLAGALVVATYRSTDDGVEDARWLRVAFAIAILMFLLQNLIDFSMFEASGTFLFALIAGSAVGLSGSDERPTETLSRRRWLRVALIGTVLAGLSVMLALVIPIGLAEGDATTATELRRLRRPGAADLYATAANRVSYNSDYAYRVGRSLLEERGASQDVRRWLDRAVEVDPLSIKSWLMIARVEASIASLDLGRLRNAYDRALAIDPRSHDVEIEYADVLAKFNLNGDAVDHYRKGLAVNAGLDPRERKRLSPQRVAEIENRIKSLQP